MPRDRQLSRVLLSFPRNHAGPLALHVVSRTDSIPHDGTAAREVMASLFSSRNYWQPDCPAIPASSLKLKFCTPSFPAREAIAASHVLKFNVSDPHCTTLSCGLLNTPPTV